MSFPELETNRLYLRDATQADPAKFQRNFNDYEIIKELDAAVPWPYPENGMVEFLQQLRAKQNINRWVWALYLKTNPAEPIGNIDLRRDATVENRGFWLARAHWGQGLMTEATTAVTDHAFDALGFNTLILSNALGNIASRRIKQKAGARLVRTEPARFVNSAYTEREIWELTKADWKNRK